MIELIRSLAYLEDLKAIDNYISIELCNPQAALSIVVDIDDAVEKLASFPELGPKLIVSGGIDSGLRYLVHERYVIVYKLQDVKVYVYRIFDCRLDYISKVMRMLGIMN